MLILLQGTFLEGCGVMVHEPVTDEYYHLIVLKEKETRNLFVEIGEKKYYEHDVHRNGGNKNGKI